MLQTTLLCSPRLRQRLRLVREEYLAARAVWQMAEKGLRGARAAYRPSCLSKRGTKDAIDAVSQSPSSANQGTQQISSSALSTAMPQRLYELAVRVGLVD
jgi:hypothetical protein